MTEPIVITRARPAEALAVFSSGSAAFAQRKGPRTLVAMTRSHSSTETSSSEPSG